MKDLALRCALWLLDRMDAAGTDDALAGDLSEEFQAGRTAGWLLREVAVAITRRVGGDLWRHPFLTVRAIGVGLGVVVPSRIAREQLAMAGIGSGPLAFWVLTAAAFLLAGWLVAHTHRPQRAAMVLAFVAYAGVAKLCLTLTHFPHFWNPQDLPQAALDLFLMSACLVAALVGGWLPAPGSRELT